MILQKLNKFCDSHKFFEFLELFSWFVIDLMTFNIVIWMTVIVIW